MRRIEEEKLEEIKGGNVSISGPILNAIVSIIEVLREAGHSLGSGIRRIGENHLCPLK